MSVPPAVVPDPRSVAQRRADVRAVREQVSALFRSPEEEAFQRLVTRTVQARRSKATAEGVVQFEVLRDGSGSGTAVVTGEVLVRTSIDPGALASLEQLVDASATVVPDLPGLMSLRNPSVPAEVLDDIARTVRGWGFPASMAHVVPLRGVLKAKGGPEATVVDPATSFAPSQVEAGQRVRVAVVDTGAAVAGRTDGWLQDVTTAEADRGLSAVDPLNAFPQPDPDEFLDFAAGHGTLVAGVVQQVAPDAAVSMYRAVDSDGVGSEVAVAQAIVRAVMKDGAQVVNLSLGAHTVDDQPLLAIEVALEMVRSEHPDVLVVAAAGNSGDTRPSFPAAQSGVVAVAGLTADLTLPAWASRGFWVTCGTVGEGIVSTYVEGKESPVLDPDPDTWTGPDPWAVCTGSSFAAPQVAGEVARRMAVAPAPTAEAPHPVPPTAHEALAALLAKGTHRPDVGVAVRIMEGTPIG